MSGWEHDTRTFERALDAILDSTAAYEEPRAGDRFACGALEVDVIHPVDPLSDIHDNIVLRIAARPALVDRRQRQQPTRLGRVA